MAGRPEHSLSWYAFAAARQSAGLERSPLCGAEGCCAVRPALWVLKRPGLPASPCHYYIASAGLVSLHQAHVQVHPGPCSGSGYVALLADVPLHVTSLLCCCAAQ